MKERKGFIGAIVLFVMYMCMSMVFYLDFTSRIDSQILYATRDNAQSFYNSEGKIFLCLYGDEYIKKQLRDNISTAFREDKFGAISYILIHSDDLEDGDSVDKVYMWFEDLADRKHINISAKSKLRGTETKVTAKASLVNPLFEMRQPIIDRESIGVSYLAELEALKVEIEEGIDIKSAGISPIYTFESDGYSDFYLTYDKLICKRDSMLEPYTEYLGRNQVFIVAKKYNEENVDFYIDKADNRSDHKLSGVIYVEGDINISTDLQFNGIMIVNGGSLNIDEGVNFAIEGMLLYLSDQDIDRESFTIRYGRKLVYKYGTYIPGFIDINIDTIKSN